MKYKTDLRDTGRRHRTKAVPKHYLKKLCPLDAAFGRSILFFESYLIFFISIFFCHHRPFGTYLLRTSVVFDEKGRRVFRLVDFCSIIDEVCFFNLIEGSSFLLAKYYFRNFFFK